MVIDFIGKNILALGELEDFIPGQEESVFPRCISSSGYS